MWKDNIGDALDDFNRAIGINPKVAQYYLERGSVLVALGYDREAILDFKKTLKLSGDLSERQKAIQQLANLGVGTTRFRN